MFRELEGLIAQQGDLVNNIAHNVEQATEKVAKGRKQLSDAERHQRSARRKKSDLRYNNIRGSLDYTSNHIGGVWGL